MPRTPCAARPHVAFRRRYTSLARSCLPSSSTSPSPSFSSSSSPPTLPTIPTTPHPAVPSSAPTPPPSLPLTPPSPSTPSSPPPSQNPPPVPPIRRRRSVMFFHFSLERNMQLYPRHFGPHLREKFVAKLMKDVDGTCSGWHGFVVAITGVDNVGKGLIR